MSTQTPAPPTQAGGGQQQRRRRGWLIALIAAGVVIVVVGAIGVFAWTQLQPPSCVKAADPSRSGAVSEYCPASPYGPRFSAMTSAADGNLWYVDENNKIARFNLKTGAVTEFDTPTPPYAVADGSLVSGGDGSLWYHANSKLWRMTLSGENTEIPLPSDMASAGTPIAGPDGNIWLPAGPANSTQPPGLLWIPTTGTGALVPVRALNQLPADANTSGMAGSPDGSLWVPVSGAVLRITPAGVVTRFTPDIPSGIRELTAGPDGMMWFLDGANHVGRLTPTGTAIYASNGNLGNNAEGLTLGPDGNFWFFTQPGPETQAMIGRVSPAGVVTKFALPHATEDVFGVGQMTAGSDGGVWFLAAYKFGFGSPQTRLDRITP